MALKLNQQEVRKIKKSGVYDKGTWRVIVLACLSITVSIFFMGAASYTITQKEVLHKLKTQDLGFILQSIATKVDSRIARAKETSLIMAEDPLLLEWTSSDRENAQLQRLSEQKIRAIALNYDYNNTFVVSAVTHEYWSESGLMDKVSAEDPKDRWFFDTLQSQKRISINIDYNKERDDTYVFINTLMGDLEHPVAITGVGLDLKDITQEFSGYKFGADSSIWLIDENGKINLADDLNCRGMNITTFLPTQISDQILQTAKSSTRAEILEYRDRSGDLFDLAFQSIESADWQLVLKIPRSETVGFLNSIKLETLLACLFALLVVSVLFYWLSQRIANPLHRALQLTKEMEEKVEQRTQELQEQNQKIMDSIDYAQRLQETIIPAPDAMAEAFRAWFVLWQPRDKVGGDFYWLKKVNNAYILALGDCTGHGVPGALMTMAVIPMLNHVVQETGDLDPADILSRLNTTMKSSFNKRESTADDGVDLGILVIKENELSFAGAKIDLYLKHAGEIEIIRGNRRSIGYRKSSEEYSFASHHPAISPGDTFYLVTDGYLDQNGGGADYSFGRKRFVALLESVGNKSLAEQSEIFNRALQEYRQDNAQRDDITLIGFQL